LKARRFQQQLPDKENAVNHFGFVIGAISVFVIGGAVVLDHFTSAPKPVAHTTVSEAPAQPASEPVTAPVIETSTPAPAEPVKPAASPKKVASVTPASPKARAESPRAAPARIAKAPVETTPAPAETTAAPVNTPPPSPPAADTSSSSSPPAAPRSEAQSQDETKTAQ
jgi:hypothetical protein